MTSLTNREQEIQQKIQVSVIVPCYNMASCLSETLQSVSDQKFPFWECIVIDDGSSDHTEELVKAFCEKDFRFKYIYKTNRGVADTRNMGVRNAHGKYILPLDGDDKISEDYIEKAINVFEKNPEVTLVYCHAEKFGDETGEWELDDYSFEKILYSNMIFCTAMYKKEDYLKTPGYNPNMIYGWEDWDFLLSLLNKNSIVVRLDEVCFYYRIRKQSRDRSINREQLSFLSKQLFLNHPDKYIEFLNPVEERNDFLALEKGVVRERKKRKKYKKLFCVMFVLNILLLLGLILLYIQK